MAQPKRMLDSRRSSLATWFFGAALILAAVAAYWPALHGAFIWDDNAWTTDILRFLRTPDGLRLIWVEPTTLQQYYPLTGTTFWLDYQLWRLWTFPYHLENLVLHLIAVGLFWRLLQKLEVPGAWLAAGIFALHPIMVESVAWVTERKNVLSLVFFLGALLAYGRFNAFWRADNSAARRRDAYWWAFILLIAALLAKTTTFSFPAVVLLIGWWRHGRVRWRSDILPTLPFFAVAIGFSLVTAWLEKTHVGATGWEWDLTLPQRCLIAGRAFWFYLGKMVYPANLCFLYPRWEPNPASFGQWLYPLTAAAALIGLWSARKRIGRAPAAAAFYYVGTIFPVLGFLNAYGMRYAFVWDHWVYLSALSLIALAAAGAVRLARRWSQPGMLWVLGAVLLPLLAVLTWNQSAMYLNLETLWRVTLAKNPDAFLAHNNLGYLLLEQNRVTEAMASLEKSLEINPRFSEAHINLGDAYLRLGQTNAAVAHFQTAVALDPGLCASYYNLGNAWLEMKRPADAVPQYQKAIEIFPHFAKAFNNLGIALMQLGRTNEAAASFRKAIDAENNPDFPDAHNNLANVLVTQKQPAEAMIHYRKAIEINPDFAEAHCGLADQLAIQGSLEEAVAEYQKTVQLKTNYLTAHYNLGVVLARLGRLEEAAAHFRMAIQLNPRYANAHGNLANVLVGQGNLLEAVEEYQRTIDLEPRSAQARYKLGLALQAQRDFRAAIAAYQQALELDPAHLQARLSLSWLLATSPDDAVRHGSQAVELAEQVRTIARTEWPQLLDTLAAAYAETGRFPEAIQTAERGLRLPAITNDQALAESLAARLKLYEAGQAFHERQ
jgi:protein O-mannosyl-transferase